MSRRRGSRRPATTRTTSRSDCSPQSGEASASPLSHSPVEEDANLWPIRFTAPENGNASAASTAIPPSTHTSSRVSNQSSLSRGRLMGPRQRYSDVSTTHASCAATRIALATRLSTATSRSSSVAPHFAIGDEARIRDRLLGDRSPSERRTFPPQGLSLQPFQTHSLPDVQDRSPQRLYALALATRTAHPHARPRVWRRGARYAIRGGKRHQARRN
jgi:hypothetical protein